MPHYQLSSTLKYCHAAGNRVFTGGMEFSGVLAFYRYGIQNGIVHGTKVRVRFIRTRRMNRMRGANGLKAHY